MGDSPDTCRTLAGRGSVNESVTFSPCLTLPPTQAKGKCHLEEPTFKEFYAHSDRLPLTAPPADNR